MKNKMRFGDLLRKKRWGLIRYSKKGEVQLVMKMRKSLCRLENKRKNKCAMKKG